MISVIRALAKKKKKISVMRSKKGFNFLAS